VIVRLVPNHGTVRVNDKLRRGQPRNLNLVGVIADKNVANLSCALADWSEINLWTEAGGRAAISDERCRDILAVR